MVVGIVETTSCLPAFFLGGAFFLCCDEDAPAARLYNGYYDRQYFLKIKRGLKRRFCRILRIKKKRAGGRENGGETILDLPRRLLGESFALYAFELPPRCRCSVCYSSTDRQCIFKDYSTGKKYQCWNILSIN